MARRRASRKKPSGGGGMFGSLVSLPFKLVVGLVGLVIAIPVWLLKILLTLLTGGKRGSLFKQARRSYKFH